MSSASAPPVPQTRRLALVYFGMAIIDVIMIVIALGVSHTTTTAFEAGVTASAKIAARQGDVLQLTLLAQVVDAPPNDVFGSRDVDLERERLIDARAEFDIALARAAADYREVEISPRDQDIAAILAEVGRMTDELYVLANLTLDHMAQGHEARASEAMSRTDRIFGELIGRLEAASRMLEQVRAENLEQQLRKTQRVRQFELSIAAAVCIIVVLIWSYGAQLAHTLREADVQRARMLEEAAAGRERMRRYADDVSHELRGPIAKMRLDIEVLLGLDRSPAEYRIGAENALAEAERLSRIVESFLFMARAENAPGALALAPLDIAFEIRTLEDFYSAMAEQAGVSLELAGSGIVVADRTLFQRAITNLISNALAHTPLGGAVRVTALANQAETVIAVEDTGNGIEPNLLERVFDRFQRGDASKGGAGLGLAIVKSIMDLHQGRVEIESVVGRGTKVSLYFPQVAPAPETAKLQSDNQGVIPT